MNRIESQLFTHILATGLRKPESEYKFHLDRKWKFDFAWPESMIACEIEGGNWISGRHTRGQGFENDCEKYAEAVVLGWRVLRVTTTMVRNGQAIKYLEALL